MKHLAGVIATFAAFFGLAMIGAITVDSASDPGPVGFGMDSASISHQVAADVDPDYGTFWVGPWTLKHGWGGADRQMVSMKDGGVTPAIHFYYWGDDISPECIENGCWSSLHDTRKDRAGWDTLAQEFVDHLNANMKGEPVVIFLETEFNKRALATYEPLDGYLEAKANFFHEHYPAAKVVMALGNWNSAAWGTWDRTAAASDYTGIQGLRSTAHHSLSEYKNLDDSLLQGAQTLQTQFGKPVFITDIGLSSHPEPDYLDHQADALAEVFAAMPDLKAAGVMAIIYRSWTDSPNMNLANHHGEAERHWGFAWAYNQTHKPSAQVWIDGVQAERAGTSAPPPTPVGAAGVTSQAETYQTKTAGGIKSDSAAVEGKAWNLWSNGFLEQTYNLTQGEYVLTILARGTVAFGVAPHMVVSLAGEPVLTADPGQTYSKHETRISTAGGVADLRIAFTNDARSDTEDRNLLLDQISITPVSEPPVARFTYTVQDLYVAVDASESSDPDGDPLTFDWAFGDGAAASGQTADHEYAAAGNYTVTLTVSDGPNSAKATQVVETSRPDHPPVAAFSTATNGLDLTVDASESSDPDGDPLTFGWAFGDGAVGSGQIADHTYEAAGSYTVTLTVSDGSNSANATQVVEMSRPNQPPIAAFSTAMNGLDLTVDASGSSDPDGDAMSYAWTFGDGNTATGRTASHTYEEAGTYTVRLTVADDTSSTTATEDVTAKGPFSATFEPSENVNEWWVEVRVTASETPANVEAKVNDKPWVTLSKTDWGTWAKSFKAPQGSTMVFRATSASGETVTSEPISWIKEPMTASFEPTANAHEWWVEVRVTASEAPASVEAKVNDKPWVTLSKTDWGTWAKSFKAPQGSTMVFRATSASGETVTSEPITWLKEPMTATFTPKTQTNNWWVEVRVSASEDLTQVDARMDGGAWVSLAETDWNSWAKGMHAKDGTEVQFRATGSSGATLTSDVFVWG